VFPGNSLNCINYIDLYFMNYINLCKIKVKLFLGLITKHHALKTWGSEI
jgi:hypothetical protein